VTVREIDFWARVRAAMHAPAHGRVAYKVGTSMTLALPDVAFAGRGGSGWLELKYVPDWPARPSTPVPVAVTPEQRRFLAAWHGTGNRAFVLLGVADEWFLFAPDVPVALPQDELYARALAYGDLTNLRLLLEATCGL
jgi:hypothetical protein